MKLKTNNTKKKLYLIVFHLIIMFCLIGNINHSPLCLEKPNIKISPKNPSFTKFIEKLNPSNQSNKRLRKLNRNLDDVNLGLIPDPLPLEYHNAEDCSLETFPIKFDLRDPDNDTNTSDSLVSDIRDQSSCGACWSFALFGSLESHLLHTFQQQIDFSEKHLIQMNGFDLSPCAGGNLKMGVAYLTSNKGPVLEIDYPYVNPEIITNDLYFSNHSYINQTIFLPVRMNLEDIGYIKKAIMEKKALYTSIYLNTSFFDEIQNTYYYDDPDDSFNKSNHAVVIVGWNDEIIATNAPGPGVFIVRNSQGSSWGDQGYFYVSYYDESIAMTQLAYFQDMDDSTYSFDTIYQHDELGWTGGLGTGDGSDCAANRFLASNDIEIAAIGFYATQASTSYQIQIYDDFSESGGACYPQTPLLDESQNGFLKYSGYYYIPLSQQLTIQKNHYFVVAIAFQSPNNNYPIPIEQQIDNYSGNARSTPGESYVSDAGDVFFDITNFCPNSNVCIKVYANKKTNNLPIANSNNIETNEDISVSISLSGSSPNCQELSYHIQLFPLHGFLSGNLPDLVYTPDENFFGSDSFFFRVSDCFFTSDPAQIDITIHSTNDSPISWDRDIECTEDVPVSIFSLGYDPDGDEMTLNIITSPSHGYINNTFPNVVYVPLSDFNGTDSFSFQLDDGIKVSNTSSVHITVNPVNDRPFAENQTYNLLEDQSLSFTLSGVDIDDDFLNVHILTSPQFGFLDAKGESFIYTPFSNFNGSDFLIYQLSDRQSVSNTITVEFNVIPVADNHQPIVSNQTFIVQAGIKQALTLTGIDDDNDALSYVISDMPQNGHLSGTGPVFYYTSTHLTASYDHFTYKVNDGSCDSSLATVRIIIIRANHAPVAENQTIETIEDQDVSFELTGNDSDNDPLTYILVSTPEHGSLTGILPFLTYSPLTNYSGTDIFKFFVYDGSKKSTIALIKISVLPKPSETKPIAISQCIEIQEDTSLILTLKGEDPKDKDLNYYLKSQPQHGQLTGTLPHIEYIPDENYYGFDMFHFQVGNGDELSDIAIIELNVISINDPPVGLSDSIITIENQPIRFNLVAHDPDNDDILYEITNLPYSGDISGQIPYLTYTPYLDFIGTDFFTFTAHDGLQTSEPVTISVQVLPFHIKEDIHNINKETIFPSHVSNGSIGVSIPNANAGKSVANGNVRMKVCNRSMAIFTRFTIPEPPPEPTEIIMYRAGGSSYGNFGSRSNADNICSSSGNKPEGYTTYKMFIGFSGNDDPANWLPDDLPVKSSNSTLIANSKSDLASTTFVNSLLNAGLSMSNWWSGLNTNLTTASNNCNDWSSSGTGNLGDPAETSAEWIVVTSGAPCGGFQSEQICVAY